MTIDLLVYKGIDVLLNTRIERIENKRLFLANSENEKRRMECDSLVIAVGMQPEQGLFLETDQQFARVRRIGDCRQPRNIQGAVWDAYEVARRI